LIDRKEELTESIAKAVGGYFLSNLLKMLDKLDLNFKNIIC
jgi:hypothetical protein